MSRSNPTVSDAVSNAEGSEPPRRRTPLEFEPVFVPLAPTPDGDYLVVAVDGSGGDAGLTNLASSTGTFWLSSLT